MIKSVTPISPVQFPNTLLQKKENGGNKTWNGRDKRKKGEEEKDYMAVENLKGDEADQQKKHQL